MAILDVKETLPSSDGQASTAIPPQRARLPEVIYVELADYCNLNCMFCGREAEIKRTGDKGGYVDLEKVKKLERPLRAAKYFGLSGRIGEPLLYPKLGELLDWLYEINPTILLRITTNGTSLSRKMAGLLGGHIDFLAISLNASNAEAYARDMRPVGYRSGTDWTANWDNLLRRITEFIEALPPPDRKKIFVIAPAHRDNIDDLPDFVRVVAGLGCSRAVITPMQVHDEAKIDMSIYWMKDKYNDVIDEAAVLGTGLGVRVEAARFYSTVKSEVDIATLCRDPLDVAYLNMEKQGETAPCCHWAEDKIPMDVYRDHDGFERFWNNEIFRRLRQKRDFKSCKACGLTRAFDEVMFHFTPSLKGRLIASGRIADAEAHNIIPDHDLVRACRVSGLNLPSLRRTVRQLGVATDRLHAIERDGAAALPALDRVCWQAFLAADPATGPMDLALAACFAGIGWGDPEYDPAGRISARWLAGGRIGSVFVRVEPGSAYDVRFTAHHVQSAEVAGALRLTACDRPLETHVSIDDSGNAVVTSQLPAAISRAHGGRLWLTVGCPDGSSAAISFSRLEISKLSIYALALRRIDRGIDRCREWGQLRQSDLKLRWSKLEILRARVFQRGLQLKQIINVVKSDPVGSLPRIWRRLTRLARIRSQ
jgi:MoaA/NifB/PqqE/SkfB family radical SAM enzyme